jgi:hypothetical protein
MQHVSERADLLQAPPPLLRLSVVTISGTALLLKS